MLLICGSGCSTLNLPKVANFGQFQLVEDPMANFKAADFKLDGNLTEKAYQGVRQAKAQNSVVLEIVGDDDAIRVLPLPDDGKSVYVSNLLSDTGVAKKLGAVEATLFRSSSDVIGGMPMEVRIAGDGKTVRPESDYALQPGDRLRVSKGTHPMLTNLIGSLLGL